MNSTFNSGDLNLKINGISSTVIDDVILKEEALRGEVLTWDTESDGLMSTLNEWNSEGVISEQ